MGVYIWLYENKVVPGSQVKADENQVWYEGEIPQYDPATQDLVMQDGKVVAKDNPEKIRALSLQKLQETDMQMGRIVEDIVDILIREKVIGKDRLPKQVVDKIEYRKSLRAKL